MTSTTPKKIRAVLIDLSGTLHIGDQPIAGAQEALQKLRDSGRKIKFLTNTSTKSSHKLLEQLNSTNLNFNISRAELVTSVLATAAYVKKHQLRPLCLMEDVSDMDLAVPVEEEEEASTSTRQSLRYDSVVVGLAPSHFHYDRLNQAFRILQEHPDHLIAVHRGNYYRPRSDEPLSLGPGAFVSALETASDCATAKVMGKPCAEFFESALVGWEEDGISRDGVCMIGDDVFGDIQGAQAVRVGTSVLVQTGKYRAGDEEKMNQHDSAFHFLVLPSIVEAIDYILSS
jgi:HAD superfamily hydrolase (TIGR01458 family)